MSMNATKTIILVCSRKNNIIARIKLKEDKTIEQVYDFIYLRSTISSDRK